MSGATSELHNVSLVVDSFAIHKLGLGQFITDTAHRGHSADVLVLSPILVLCQEKKQDVWAPGSLLTILEYDLAMRQYKVSGAHTPEWVWVTKTALLGCTRPKDDLLALLGCQSKWTIETEIWRRFLNVLQRRGSAYSALRSAVLANSDIQTHSFASNANKRPPDDAVEPDQAPNKKARQENEQ